MNSQFASPPSLDFVLDGGGAFSESQGAERLEDVQRIARAAHEHRRFRIAALELSDCAS